MKIGTDIVSCSRIEKVFSSDERRRKCFSQYEISFCEHKGQSMVQSLAGLFAAKEAISKAFGFGIGGVVSFLNVEILHDDLGSPFVRLLGKAKLHFESQNWREIEISIAHCDDYATAVCFIS